MAKFRIALGSEIEAVTGDEMKSGLDALRADMVSGLAKPKRIMRQLVKAFGPQDITVGDTKQLSLGRPSAGRVWVITRATVTGADDHTALADVMVALYIGDPANVGQGQCVLHGQQVPFTSTQNEHAWVCHDREDVFAQATGVTATAVAAKFVVNLMVWEYRDKDIDSQVI